MTRLPPTGIPTVYNGVQFRSRIEARWAAFFDALGWEWDYEPIDLAGYIPDFILAFKHAPFLVEVKSETQLPAGLHDHKPKIMQSTWDREAMIVGSRIGVLYGMDALCGVIGTRERIEGELEWKWDDAMLFSCVPCRGISIRESNGSWMCRRCGVDDGPGHCGTTPEGFIQHAWLDAGNAVQWRKPQ